MRRTYVLVFLLLAVALTVGGPQAMAQRRAGTITGVVLGPDDKPVPHASVAYQSGGGSAPHVVRADAKGQFLITKLRADNYDVRASSKGVFSDWEKNVSVHAGQTKTITLTLIYAKEMPKATGPGKP
jgi:hypothetical protein